MSVCVCVCACVYFCVYVCVCLCVRVGPAPAHAAQSPVPQVARNKLQLVGVSAMLIAAKFEEIYAPEVKDFVYITDKACARAPARAPAAVCVCVCVLTRAAASRRTQRRTSSRWRLRS